MIDWSGDDQAATPLTPDLAPYGGSNYSWVDFASAQGFPTLAIDRLGNGLSDRK